MNENDFKTGVLMDAKKEHDVEVAEGAFDERYPGEQEDSRSMDDIYEDRAQEHFERTPW